MMEGEMKIEGVEFLQDVMGGFTVVYPTSDFGQFSNSTFSKFINKPPMKMILIMAKDKP